MKNFKYLRNYSFLHWHIRTQHLTGVPTKEVFSQQNFIRVQNQRNIFFCTSFQRHAMIRHNPRPFVENFFKSQIDIKSNYKRSEVTPANIRSSDSKAFDAINSIDLLFNWQWFRITARSLFGHFEPLLPLLFPQLRQEHVALGGVVEHGEADPNAGHRYDRQHDGQGSIHLQESKTTFGNNYSFLQ